MTRLTALLRTAWKRPAFSYVQFIKWWMLLRAALVTTTLAVVFFFSPAGGTSSAGGSILAPAVTGLTLLVSWLFYRSVRRDDPPEIGLYLQYFLDIFLISLLNLIAKPADVSFVPLYLLTITLAGILSLRTGALFAASAAALFYLPVGLGALSLGFTFSRQFEVNVFYLNDKRIWLNVGLQVFLFYMIALVTSHLGRRLRRTGGELEDLRRVLRQQRVDTSEILRNIDTGLITVNPGGTVVYANPAACRMLALEPRRALGRNSGELFRSVCPELNAMIEQAAGSRERRLIRLVRFETARGPLTVAVNPSPMFEQGGRLRGVSLILQDVSPELRASELEQRAGKLEAVAELSAALAHEIKNPLASIRSAVEMLREPAPSRHDGAEKKLMDCVIRESDRLSDLLRQFLQFASGSLGPLEAVRLGEAAATALEAALPHPDWRAGIEVELQPEAAEMCVRANAASL
ncbi:PAS domain-containing protein, partial [bacterium]|nr:PAS domain-containing protein [bacterium]